MLELVASPKVVLASTVRSPVLSRVIFIFWPEAGCKVKAPVPVVIVPEVEKLMPEVVR